MTTPTPLRHAALDTSRSVLALQRREQSSLQAAKQVLEKQAVDLADSISLLHATLEASPDAVIANDLEGRAVVWNQRFVDLWQLTPEQLRSRDTADWTSRCLHMTADPAGYLRQRDAAAANPDRPSSQIVTLRDGRMLERRTSPQHLDGRCVGVVVHWRDVTEQCRADEARRRSEAELRTAQRVAGVGSWQWRVGETAVQWSPQMFRIFRRRPSLGTLGRAELAAMLDVATLRQLDANVEAAATRGAPFSIDLQIVRGDGRRAWVNARVEAERGADGRVVLWRGSVHDIGAARATQQALQASRGRLQALFDHAQNAILLTDDDGRHVDVNPACCELLGRSREQLIGASAADFLLPREGAEGRIRSDWQAFLREGRQSGTLRLQRADGSLIDADYSGVARVQPGLHLIILSDVTERRRARAMRAQKEAAEAANRGKSAFVARMSHELRTPLNAILGFSEVLLLDTGEPLSATQRHSVEHVRGAGRHLLALIEDVLDMSRIEAGSMRLRLESVDALAATREALKSLEPLAAGHGVRLALDAGDGGTLPRVLGDRTRLRQVIVNLVSNAIKYNRPGGSVHCGVVAHGDRQRIRVADTGLGLTAAQRSRLFEPFERLGRESSGVEGTGIGLVIVKSLVELMGGTLRVESEPGRGSVFTVELAIAGDVEPTVPVPLAPIAAAPARRRAEVLYVDDDDVNRMLMQAFFALRPGDALAVAVDAASGIAAARARCYDAILVDMRLPDGAGLDVLRAVRGDAAAAGTAPPPCIAVSAEAMPEQVAAALAAGFDDYLTKPVSAAALYGSLDRVLG